MTLQRKLALFLLAAAFAPLVGVSFAVLAWAERDLGRRAASEHLARAGSGAANLALAVADIDAALSSFSETWRPDRLREAELRGLLVVLSRQVPAADASAIVDADGSTRAVLPGGAASPAATDAFLAAVRAARPAAAKGLVLTAYDDPAGGLGLAAVRAVAAADGRPWLVGARLAVEPLRRRLDAAVPEGGAAYLVDARRTLLASSGAGPLRADARAELAGRLDPVRAGAVQGRRVVAAWAPLDDGTGWGVLVAVPAETAYTPLVRMRRGVLAASGAVLAAALLVSFLVARRTTAGLARIESAARALGSGELSVRLPVAGSDEIAEVSRTFNAMAGELSSARLKLERWNEELQREVEARTRELADAQAQLVEAQKLAAIGQLGAGVAHEINNPLTNILGHAQLLLEGRAPAADDKEALERIVAAARRCRDVTQNLLRFSQQRQAPAFQPLDVNRVVSDALSLAEGQVRASGVGFAVELQHPAPSVTGDPGHLAQVVLNLVSNARTACLGKPGAGILVATRRAGDDVEIVVEDGGKGIPPEHLGRIFEPFFTTKDQWSNVGLGLSVSYRIVSEHGGRIQVRSAPGEGTTFTVRLPADQAATASSPA